MASRLEAATAALAGLAATYVTGFVSLVLAAGAVYDTLTPLLPMAFVIFTVLTLPTALLVAWNRAPWRRGFAAGLLTGWAAVGIWIWMGAPGLLMT